MSLSSPSAMLGVRGPIEAARAVLRQYWNELLPVDPGMVARLMGVNIKTHICFDGVPFPYSGYFELSNGIPTIHVNLDEPVVRQRFTTAHELGHYVLGHKDAPRDLPQNFGSAVPDSVERSANQFAAELLMPSEAVRKLVASGRFSSVQDLAQVFQVSKPAMGYRLSNLQIPTFNG